MILKVYFLTRSKTLTTHLLTVGATKVHAADPKEVEKAVMIIRAYGHSTTETLVATPWKEFLDML